MNKKAAGYGLWFYLVTIFFSFMFPKLFYGNVVILSTYFLICLVFLYFIYFSTPKKKSTSPNSQVDEEIKN